MREWPVQDAKARFSELINTAVKEGPQAITRRGKMIAVVVSCQLWDRLTSPTRRSAVDVLLAPEPRLDDLPASSRRSARARKKPRG